jgi:hypothetical protein
MKLGILGILGNRVLRSAYLAGRNSLNGSPIVASDNQIHFLLETLASVLRLSFLLETCFLPET